MAAISLLFVLYLVVQVLLGVVAFRLARKRGDAALALSLLVVAGGTVGPFVVNAVLEVLVVQTLCLGLYAFVSRPNARRGSSRQ